MFNIFIMKNLLLFLLFVSIFSCTKTEIDTNIVDEVKSERMIPTYQRSRIVGYKNESNIKLASQAILDKLIEKGLLSNLRNSCRWSDGFGGDMDCGGKCVVITYEDTSVGIGCIEDGQMSHTGLWRPVD